MNETLKEKLKESFLSVLPITIIVLILAFTIISITTKNLILFLISSALLVIGMWMFTIGAESSMSIMGERVGEHLAKSRNVWVIAFVSFIVGIIVTVAEPDLLVLASQVSEIPNSILIMAVAIGSGIFLSIAFIKTILNIKLSHLLAILYIITFIITPFVPESFLAIAFDAGGVTTGPITVPFIIALGVGLTSARIGNKTSDSDSFGLLGLCSIGPIITVMILGFIYKIDASSAVITTVSEFQKSGILLFLETILEYSKSVAISILPILVFFIIYQLFAIKISKRELLKILSGIICTFIGLVVFFTGVEIGFMPIGNMIGTELAQMNNTFILIAVAFLMGIFIIEAEPAIVILVKQISEITDGAIPVKPMKICFSIATALSIVIAVIRIVAGINIMYFLVPCYIISIILAFYTPDVFVGIAFDSGGVTGGTMTGSFVLPFLIGIAQALDKDIMVDAFGVIAITSALPLIIIQILGIIYKLKVRKVNGAISETADEEIIELGEE